MPFPASAVAGASCDGQPGARGDCRGESCCERLAVPGGSYRDVADEDPTPVSVSVKTFYLDKYDPRGKA